jgi:hypothetical protein
MTLNWFPVRDASLKTAGTGAAAPVQRTYQHTNTPEEDHEVLSPYTSCYSCAAHIAKHVTAPSHRPQEDIILVGTYAQLAAALSGGPCPFWWALRTVSPLRSIL